MFGQGLPRADDSRKRAISKTLSEYMLYLLIKQPEMLAVGQDGHLADAVPGHGRGGTEVLRLHGGMEP